ncbi:MAG: putative quinol monooxygenase [Kiloniellales bacterium]
MIVITGTVRIAEGKLAAARPIMEKVLRLSRAEKGCISYAYALDVLDPTLIRISEEWESLEDLKAHAASAHVAEWRSQGPELGISDRDLKIHTVTESKAL